QNGQRRYASAWRWRRRSRRRGDANPQRDALVRLNLARKPQPKCATGKRFLAKGQKRRSVARLLDVHFLKKSALLDAGLNDFGRSGSERMHGFKDHQPAVVTRRLSADLEAGGYLHRFRRAVRDFKFEQRFGGRGGEFLHTRRIQKFDQGFL